MEYSKLKNELEMLQLTHKHELQLITLKYEQEVSLLTAKCTHNYDDGTSAHEYTGTQYDSSHVCKICGKRL